MTECYYVLEVDNNTTFRIDIDVAQKIVDKLDHINEVLRFTDIFGGECFVPVRKVTAMFYSSPQLRAAEREHRHELDMEDM